jgi:hypothetical protein
MFQWTPLSVQLRVRDGANAKMVFDSGVLKNINLDACGGGCLSSSTNYIWLNQVFIALCGKCTYKEHCKN